MPPLNGGYNWNSARRKSKVKRFKRTHHRAPLRCCLSSWLDRKQSKPVERLLVSLAPHFTPLLTARPLCSGTRDVRQFQPQPIRFEDLKKKLKVENMQVIFIMHAQVRFYRKVTKRRRKRLPIFFRSSEPKLKQGTWNACTRVIKPKCKNWAAKCIKRLMQNSSSG